MFFNRFQCVQVLGLLAISGSDALAILCGLEASGPTQVNAITIGEIPSFEFAEGDGQFFEHSERASLYGTGKEVGAPAGMVKDRGSVLGASFRLAWATAGSFDQQVST